MDTKKLRQKILDLAIHGKLVPQDPNDEPASVLLGRIRAEKERLIKEGKIKAPKRSKSTSGTSHYPKEEPWDLPEGWKWCAINDISTSELGKTLDKNKNSGEEKPYLCALNVKWNSFDLTTIKTIRIEKFEQERYRLLPGDLLVCEGGDVGRCAIWNSDAEFYYQNALHRVRCNSMIIPQYLLTVLRYYKDIGLIDEISKGVTIKHFTSQVFQTLRFPIPPIKEQRRIISCISYLFESITQIDNDRTKLLTLTNNTKALVLDLAIHGKLVPQDPSDEPAIEFLRRINPDFKPSDNLHYGDKLPNGWICGTYGELNQHKNKSVNPMDSPKEHFELYSVPIYDKGMPEYLIGKDIGSTKQSVDKGDVLLCKINPRLNRSWVIEHYRTDLTCIASSEWLIFHSDALFPEYARMFFMSPGFRSLMLSNVSGVGGYLMRARASAVEKYPIWIPPIKEQIRIMTRVKKLISILDLLSQK